MQELRTLAEAHVFPCGSHALLLQCFHSENAAHIASTGGGDEEEGQSGSFKPPKDDEELIIASLRGDVSQAAKVSQGNACVNVIDFSVGGGACRVVRLNVCDHLTSWTRPASVEDGLNSVMSVSVDDSEA